MTRSRPASFFSSLSLWVLVALAGGLAAGAAAQSYGIPGGTGAVALIDALGQLWLNALRMTIIPLVFSSWSPAAPPSATQPRPGGWR